MPLSLRRWDSSVEPSALAFLEKRYADSMFLLGNRAQHGVTLGSHPNSGDFFVLCEGSSVVGVFMLTRRGNLILSGDCPREAAALIVAQVGRSLKGVLGSYELASAVWDELALPTCSFSSREVLYRLDTLPACAPVPGVRFLEPADFSEWLPIRHAYQAEEGILHELPEAELRANFVKYCGMREYWGTFQDGRLIATAALNAVVADIGQVGGVYTVPSERGKGHSQRIMRQLLSDCASVHGLRKMILFTGEKNFAAQRVYEKLGFGRIGRFGIFFV
jgi:GNAT superfamily N-acetyltransferase